MARDCTAWRGLIGTCLLIQLPIVGTARAQDACDPSLVARARAVQRLAYSSRGDRCEGLYAQDVASGTVLTPISFTASFEDFDPSVVKRLFLTWPDVGNNLVYVRAQSRRPKFYYRMDAVQSPGQTRFEWKTDLLAEFKLRQTDLGVMAWTPRRIGDVEQPVHVPLRIGAGREAAAGKEYALILVPGAELDDVYHALLAIDARGQPLHQVGSRRELGLGFYPAGRSFRVTIAVPAKVGLYRLDVDAGLRNGTTASIHLMFLHPG